MKKYEWIIGLFYSAIFIGLSLYYLYRLGAHGSQVELFLVGSSFFLLGMGALGFVYSKGRKNLSNELDDEKRADLSRKLARDFVRMLILYCSIFLIYIAVNLWGHWSRA